MEFGMGLQLPNCHTFPKIKHITLPCTRAVLNKGSSEITLEPHSAFKMVSDFLFYQLNPNATASRETILEMQ